MRTINKKNKGFTLIEMIVSLGLFTIIMFIATSAFLSIVNTDRKARGVRIAADNLNLSLEDMTRRIKTGYSYYCGESASGVLDCAVTPGTAFSFNDQSSPSNRIIYKRATGSSCGPTYSLTQGCILRTGVLVTSPEIDITRLNFYVKGSIPGSPNNTQPMVVVVVDGTLGTGSTSATFSVQSTVTQRIYDN